MAYSLKSFYNVRWFYSNRDAQKIWAGGNKNKRNKSTSQKTIDNIEPWPLFILCCAWQFLSDCHLFFLFLFLFFFFYFFLQKLDYLSKFNTNLKSPLCSFAQVKKAGFISQPPL